MLRFRRSELAEQCPQDKAKVAARLLLGSYPNGRPSDPEVYTRQVVGLLMGYPTFVAERIADPAAGLVTRKPFLPSLGEVKGFAEAMVAPQRQEIERLWRDVEQLSHRDETERPSQEVIDQQIADWETRKARQEFQQKEIQADRSERLKALAERTQCAPGEAIRNSRLVNTGSAAEMEDEQ